MITYQELDNPQKWLITQIEKAYIEREDLNNKDLLKCLLFLINKWKPYKVYKEEKDTKLVGYYK